MPQNTQSESSTKAKKRVKNKLPSWKNAPTVSDLRNDLTAATPFHDTKVANINAWLKVRNPTVPKYVGKSSYQPRLVRKQAEWKYAALSEPFLVSENLFEVSPVTYEDKLGATQNALVLNNQFSTVLNRTRLIDRAVRKLVDTGTLVLRVNWKYVDEDYVAQEPVYDFKPAENETELALLKTILDAQAEDPNTFNNTAPPEILQAIQLTVAQNAPIIPYVVGSNEVTKTRILKNHPTVTVVDFRDIIVDPTCMGNLDDAKFIIYMFTTSLSELKEAGVYSNLDKIQPENVSPVLPVDQHSPTYSGSFQFQDDARKQFIAYEYWGYWDIDGTGVTKPIVATFVDDVMIRLEENPFPDGKPPFTVTPYMPIDGDVGGTPDAELLEDNQKIVGAVYRGIIDTLAKSAAGQTGMPRNFLDTVNLRKYMLGEDYEYNAAMGNPHNLIIQHRHPEIAQSALNIISLQTMDAEALSGARPFAGQNSGTSLSESATAIRSALDAAAKRESGILRRIAAAIVDVGRKIIAMNAIWLSDKEVVRITNESFVAVKREDLAGNFDLRLTISTAEEDEVKANRIEYMTQTLGNKIPFEMTKEMLEELFKIRKLPVLARKIKEYTPEPDPIEQQRVQLELAKLQAEIDKIKSEVLRNRSDAQKKQSDAGHKDALTDKENLNYIEQERGVSHARKTREIAAQAEANAGLEVVRDMLRNRAASSKSEVTDNKPEA